MLPSDTRVLLSPSAVMPDCTSAMSTAEPVSISRLRFCSEPSEASRCSSMPSRARIARSRSPILAKVLPAGPVLMLSSCGGGGLTKRNVSTNAISVSTTRGQIPCARSRHETVLISSGMRSAARAGESGSLGLAMAGRHLMYSLLPAAPAPVRTAGPGTENNQERRRAHAARRPSAGVGLQVRRSAREGRQALEMRANPPQRRIGADIDVEALRVVHLWHDADVGERQQVAVHVLAVSGQALHLLLERREAEPHPVRIPGVHRGVILAERRTQIVERPQIVEWVDVAGYMQRKRAHLRARERIARQQRRLRVRVLEIFEDCERLAEHMVAVQQHRNQFLRIERAQLHQLLLPGDALEVECNAHPVGGGAAEITVELHGGTLMPAAAARSCCAAPRDPRCRLRASRPA